MWWIKGLLFLLGPGLREELRKIMSLLDDLRSAVAKVSADVDKLSADVAVKVAADATALAAAEANAVQQSDVDSVNALSAKVEAADATVTG